MQKMAQAMPSLMKAARPLTSEEEIGIGYYEMDPGRKRYVCGPGDGDQRVLSHVFVDESMVIFAGAREVIEEKQAILLHKTREAAGQVVLDFKEKLKSFRSPDNIENRGRAITFGPTIARGQHKIAPAKHIQLACDNDSNMRTKITKLSTLFAEASHSIFRQHLDGNYIDLYKRRFSVDCVLAFGHHENIFTTTSQINYSSPQGGDLQRDLPTFGGLHVDHTDDPARYTCLLFLSNLKPSVFPGRFCLPLQREYCIPTPFTALIFKGTHLHVGLPPMQMSATDKSFFIHESSSTANGLGFHYSLSSAILEKS
jgi:hypothetical protein